MSLYNYKRAYSLTIGKPPTYVTTQPAPFTDEILGLGVDPRQPPNFNSVELNAIEITTKGNLNPLSIEAEIEGSVKSSGSDPVKATIKIRNLSSETLSIVKRKNNFVILKAGYAFQEQSDALPMIFSGQVESCKTYRDSTDIITELTCISGYTPLNSVRVSLSIPPKPRVLLNTQITYKDVFDRLLKAWEDNGISYDDTTVDFTAGETYISRIPLKPESRPLDDSPVRPSFPFQIPLENGWSFEGYLKDAMDEVCSAIGYRWYIQNNLLYIYPKYVSQRKQAIKLDFNLIKSIRPQEEGIRETANAESNKGFKVKVSLDGRLTLADYVDITDDKGVSSIYTITQVNHVLDFRGNFWDTDFLCERIDR